MEQYQRATDDYCKAIELNPRNNLDYYQKLGIGYLADKDWQMATKLAHMAN